MTTPPHLPDRFVELLIEFHGDRKRENPSRNDAPFLGAAAVTGLPAKEVEQSIFDFDAAAAEKNVRRAFWFDKRCMFFSGNPIHAVTSLTKRKERAGMWHDSGVTHIKNLVLTSNSAAMSSI